MWVGWMAAQRWQNDRMSKASLGDVIAAETPGLLALPGVVGVAEGSDQGQPCIVVYVATEPGADVAASLAGYPVVVRLSGEIRAQ